VKVLIAFDGSDYGQAALRDAFRAGFPTAAEVLVVTVGDDIEDAADVADRGATLLRLKSPDWQVRSQALLGSPARALIELADIWQPDLLISGSHGRNAFGRFVLGSVSQKLLTEARCSVRIVRPPARPPRDPLRLVVATDGSTAAETAVREVASRSWPASSEATVVVAIESLHDRFENGVDHEIAGMQVADWALRRRNHAIALAQSAATILRKSVAKVETAVEPGPAKKAILAVAGRVRADCVFLGAVGAGESGDGLLGGVTAGVAHRAECTVEVVRRKAAPCSS